MDVVFLAFLGRTLERLVRGGGVGLRLGETARRICFRLGRDGRARAGATDRGVFWGAASQAASAVGVGRQRKSLSTMALEESEAGYQGREAAPACERRTGGRDSEERVGGPGCVVQGLVPRTWVVVGGRMRSGVSRFPRPPAHVVCGGNCLEPYSSPLP